MPTTTIDLPHGTVSYRVAGPEAATAPPVVFVHGFLVNGTLWSATADALAEAGTRSYAPDWPLGSHSIPLPPDTDQSPRGVARQVISFLDALGLEDVTLVGNDTGGAICQFVLDTDPGRIGRLVLTNCDAFNAFPPAPFDLLFKAFRGPRRIAALMAPMRSTRLRHSALGYGTLVTRRLDPELTLGWAAPTIHDPRIRADTARFARQVDPRDLDTASEHLGAFPGPALLVWGTGDRFFKLDFARRLRDTLTDARLVEVEGGRTFIPHDHPERLAEEIAAFASAPAPARSRNAVAS